MRPTPSCTAIAAYLVAERGMRITKRQFLAGSAAGVGAAIVARRSGLLGRSRGGAAGARNL